MSLNRKDKEALHQAILRLARTINDLESTTVDPRVLDMLEIAGSLLEQQVEMDLIFEQADIEETNEVVLFEQGEMEDIHKVVHINFDEDNDIPSPEDLEDWFNIGD